MPQDLTRTPGDRLALLATWLLSLLLVTYPIFDFDMYWHLANGREMVNAGRIVSEEIFSYTHPGEKFANHEWLGQIIFYLVWDKFGAYGLFGLKLLVTSLLTWLLYRTTRLAGSSPWTAAVLCVLAVLAGINRFHERPELFSLLNTAFLGYLLYAFRAGQLPHRWLWLIPPLLVIWDWLHGAVYGLTLLGLFVVGENAKQRFPAWCHGKALAADRLKSLNLCFGATMLAMLLNPLGLRSYGIFVGYVVGEANFNQEITEFMPLTWEESEVFILLLAGAVLLAMRHIRRMDFTQLLLMAVFAGAAVRFTRVAGISALVLTPVMATLFQTCLQHVKGKLENRLYAALPTLVAALLVLHGYPLKFSKIIENDEKYHYLELYSLGFDWRIDNNFYPVGAVNFVKAMGLGGNLYNSGNLGGYLAYHITPERKIFEYNMGRVFGDPFDYEEHPKKLVKWNINYAIVDTEAELERLFPSSQWAQVYRDPASVLVLKRTPENGALIEQYEIRYFHPVLSDAGLRARAHDPEILPRLAEEMGVHLAYRRDRRIAGLWAEMLEASPELLALPRMQVLLKLALGYNDDARLKRLASETHRQP